jgi:hypothetical protein
MFTLMDAVIAGWPCRCWIAVLCIGSLAAQRTWIVDHAGRPGTDFTDLPPAVAAAAPGDTIIVRYDPRGFLYSAVVVTAGLSIVCEAVDAVQQVPITGLTIRDVQAGQPVILNGLAPGSISIERVPSLVTVESCNSGPIWITDCAHVALHMTWVAPGFAFPPLPALDIKRSHVRFDQVSASGFGAANFQYSSVIAEDSVLVATRSSFAGTPATFSVWCQPVSSGAPGMILTRSQVSLGHACYVYGGDAWCYMSGTVCARGSIEGSGSVVAKDNTVEIRCGTSTPVAPATPYFLSAGAAVSASVMDLRVDAPAGWLALVVASFAPPSTTPTSIGALGIDPGGFIVVAVGRVATNGTWTVPMYVEPGLVPATVFAMQAALMSPNGELFLTFPTYAGLRP